jgi:GNAT superfamily N-acetyltransferase
MGQSWHYTSSGSQPIVHFAEYHHMVPTRVTGSEDVPRLARSLAQAYRFNPFVRWMFAEDLSATRLEGLFRSLVEFGVCHGLVYRSTEGDGAAIWFPPIGDERYVPDHPPADVAADTAEWSSGRRVAALQALAASRPADPHFYLDAVGVVPSRRRLGVASDLLEPALAECDVKSIGAYLENSDPANTSFYARHGFEEVAQIVMPEGAPPIVSMWRPPQVG